MCLQNTQVLLKYLRPYLDGGQRGHFAEYKGHSKVRIL